LKKLSSKLDISQGKENIKGIKNTYFEEMAAR
jgi:hypothetical protein